MGKLTLLVIIATSLGSARSSPLPQSSKSVQTIRELVSEGHLASAQELLSAALATSPGDAELYNLDGVVKAQTRNFEGSESSFQKAIRLAPSSVDAYLNLGHLYQEWTPQTPILRQKALNIYNHILELDPPNIEANYQSAVLLMEEGFYVTSLQRLSKLPIQAQSRSQALSVRCGDQAGSGNKQFAAEAADRMLQSSDLVEADVLMLLPLLAKHNDASLEITLLEGLKTRNLATVASLTDLGLIYKEQGRLGDARKALDQAAQFPPNSVALLMDLARVANEQKDYPGALGYLAHARELEPQNASIHFFWGIVCVQMNLAEEAYQALKRAVTLSPDNAYYNYAMGAVALQRVDATEASTYFQKYCQLKPGDPRGRLALGAAYFEAHDEARAKEVVATIVNIRETAPGAHYYLARIADHQGDYPQALAQLEMALKAFPDYADAYAERGLIRLKQKDYVDARNDLQKALKINPDNYTANLNLLMLYQRTKDPLAVEQAKRFDEVSKERAQRVKDFLRTVQVRP